MKFFKYPSLENHYRQKFIEKLRLTSPSVNEEWVAQEKLHGANYAIYWDSRSGEIKSAKRTGFVEDEKFFNHEQADRVAFPKIKEVVTNHGYVIFYGELCGGNVQKGVDYSEEQRFVCFDIALVRDENPDEPEFFTFDQMLSLCNVIDLEYAPIIKRGSFENLLQLDNLFDSAYGNFVAEGFVMKPINPHFLHTGSRVVIKSKNSKFSEKEKSDKKPKAPRVESDNEKLYTEGVTDYINENRLNAVTSKLGEVDVSMTFKIMGLLIQDAIEDFDKDNESSFKSLDKPERQYITKQLQNVARPIVQSNL